MIVANTVHKIIYYKSFEDLSEVIQDCEHGIHDIIHAIMILILL